MPLPRRGHRICALLSASLALFLLLPFAHGGVTIENIPGVYTRHETNKDCPATVTVRAAVGDVASIVTAAGICRPGKARLIERPRAGPWDAITKLLVNRGEGLVGTIVLGRTTAPVRCRVGSERIRANAFLNFIRPRTFTAITLNNRTTRFNAGQYYLILREVCIYVRRQPSAPTSPPTITGSPKSPLTPLARTTPAPSANAVPAKVNMWVWLGPCIGIAVLALCSVVAFVAVRHVRAQWTPFTTRSQSEASLGGFFDSLSSSPPPPAELDETVPRMRYSTDMDFYGEQMTAHRRVSLPPPPRDEFESSSEDESDGG